MTATTPPIDQAGGAPQARHLPASRTSLVERLEENVPAVSLCLTVAAAAAWAFLGITPDQIGAFGALVLFVGFPLYAIASERAAERRRGIAAINPRTWRQSIGEAAVVAVLLWLGWNLLLSAIRGPQPGDIVCEVYDPRLGDCVVEGVYPGE
jgi:hypothetical protein